MGPRGALLTVAHCLVILLRSLHRPVAVVDGSVTKNVNKTGVRLWTGCSSVSRLLSGEAIWSSMRRYRYRCAPDFRNGSDGFD